LKAEYLDPQNLFDDEDFVRALIGHFIAEGSMMECGACVPGLA
jgi:hypothetical protein